MESNDVTVLVCSCDKYEDAWYPFFKLKEKFWPNCPYPVLLNTESKSFRYHNETIPTLNLYKNGESVPWGRRLMEHLKRIHTKYVILMLEDFFLVEPVDQKRLSQCVDWMEQDRNIECFSFVPVEDPCNEKSMKYPGFERRPRNGKYRFNCQAALWQREKLIRCLRPYESPWEWEVYGNVRSWRDRCDFYVQQEGSAPIINYNYCTDGSPIFRGRWHMKYVKSLFEEHDISMNYSIRGTVEDLENRVNAPQEKSKTWKCIFDPIYPLYVKLCHIRNLF